MEVRESHMVRSGMFLIIRLFLRTCVLRTCVLTMHTVFINDSPLQFINVLIKKILNQPKGHLVFSENDKLIEELILEMGE